MKILSNLLVIFLIVTGSHAQNKKAQNPVIFADVPDLSIIRVGNDYYMSSTTMHMSPGVPIMKSKDLINWKLINYASVTLGNSEELNLDNGKNNYGRGSWASNIRFHNNTFYVTTFAQTTGKTYIYTTRDIEKGPWKEISFSPAYHDHSILFDDDGSVYMVYGNGKLFIKELKPDLSGIKENGLDQVLIENANSPAGNNIMLGAEGSQLYKVKGKYYLFNIVWPQGGMRTVLIHRADKITGPWEGKIGLQDLGVAQGGLIDTPDGKWFSYLFRDYGGVGRIPYFIPVKWEDGWPILGENNKVPQYLDLPESKGLIPGIVDSDDFNRKKEEKDLPLVWQWNHNPDNSFWSVRERKGYLRLKTASITTTLTQAKNTLTQRTFGPECSATTLLEVSKMKEGDFAGLTLLQKDFGLVGVKAENGSKRIVMIETVNGNSKEIQSVPFTGSKIYFKAACNFRDKADLGSFFYSLDGKEWKSIGNTMKLPYTLPHFMGYRFGLFNYAEKNLGGYVDFDYFHLDNKM